MRPRTKQAVVGIALASGIALLRPRTHANQVARHRLELIGRWLRHLARRLRGVAYRTCRREPAPDVHDDVLADRIRSSLGGLERRLDVPRVHVMVADHVALLHGAVGTLQEADEIERAVASMSGVAGVESYLHIGLGGGDSRPSAGRAGHLPSKARAHLIDAATTAGVDAADATQVVRAILASFAERLPSGEREQVAAHLTADVRELFTPPRRSARGAPSRTLSGFLSRVGSAAPELAHYDSMRVTAAVLQALRSLVPEEQDDVTAVLPTELRDLWHPFAASSPPQPSSGPDSDAVIDVRASDLRESDRARGDQTI